MFLEINLTEFAQTKFFVETKFNYNVINCGIYEFHLYGLNKKMVDLMSIFIERETKSFKGNYLSTAFFRKMFLDIHAHYFVIVKTSNFYQIAIDPYSIIKLYSTQNGDILSITDDYQKLASNCKNQSFTIDSNALKYFFLNNYTPSKHTIFKEVKKLEPATLYTFFQNNNTEAFYLDLDKPPIDGSIIENILYENFRTIATTYKLIYTKATSFLSGGMDSSLLLRLLVSDDLFKGKVETITGFANIANNSVLKTSNEKDIFLSQKLSEDYNIPHQIIEYDFYSEKVVQDFILLRDNLFNEYASAMAYVGYTRGISDDNIIFNGQNADSVLSFGGAGFPYFEGIKLKGLAGFFLRHFQFFCNAEAPFLQRFIAKKLQKMYYRKSKIEPKFSANDYFLGIGLNKQNFPYWQNDPIYSNIDSVKDLAQWMTENYLTPINDKFPNLSNHGKFQLLYLQTFMQGSDNRNTVYPALLLRKDIVLPYTYLFLLESMVQVKANWKFAFFGKYPNYALGKGKLKLPKYILNRHDIVDIDEEALFNKAILRNEFFISFLKDELLQVDWSNYKNILSDEIIMDYEDKKRDIKESDIPFLLKIIWIDSIIRKFI